VSVDRHVWAVSEVADTVGPGANLRNYLEQRDVRRCLGEARMLKPVRRAYDVGCGYGRLTMVLMEVAESVVGFEREASFVEEAQRLLPGAVVRQVDTLEHLPAPEASCDFAMTFTVLQHMRDPEARAVLEEVNRVARGGVVLLTEETDQSLADRDEAGAGGVTVGRSEETYAAWMAPFVQVLQFRRQIEPGYPREHVGSYMMFLDRR
jgi:ubiquinone/menaquinone biosynthesis C-methylase UbiE